MKNLYLLLLISLTLPALGQEAHQSPILNFLGSDLAAVGDYTTGLNAYDGLGQLDYYRANSYLHDRGANVSWIPLSGQPNGWGLLGLWQRTANHALVSGSAQGDYQLSGSANYQQDGVHFTSILRAQGNQRVADENKDGFRDQEAYRNYFLAQHFSTHIRKVQLRSGLRHLNQRQQGGQLGYHWPSAAGSDSLYGFGRKAAQWIANLSGKVEFGKNDLLHVHTLWRQQQETGDYGQRVLAGKERRVGAAANYRHLFKGGESRVFSYYQRQRIKQEWDITHLDNRWDNYVLGASHRQFMTKKWLLEASLTADYHTASRWQVLPYLRTDYVFSKKVRLGLMAGRDYRWQRPLTALRPYLQSQRQWQLQSDGPDRMWYTGGLLQLTKIAGDEFTLNLKAVYQARLLSQQLVTDPSEAGSIRQYHSQDRSWQQQLFVTSFWRYRAFKGNLSYRWRDKPLPLLSGMVAAYLDSRHALLANVVFQRHINGNRIISGGSIKTDYLLRGRQALPNGGRSPILHQLRSQVEVNWRQIGGKRLRPTIFFGVENLTNQQQTALYEGAAMPFGSDFDGSSRWGSTVGQRWFAGLRVGF